jgi:hypothetical protein
MIDFRITQTGEKIIVFVILSEAKNLKPECRAALN